MVAVAKTVVNEGAMVIEQLDTSVADRAMEARFTFYHLTIRAEVVEVEADFKRYLHHSREAIEWT